MDERVEEGRHQHVGERCGEEERADQQAGAPIHLVHLSPPADIHAGVRHPLDRAGGSRLDVAQRSVRRQLGRHRHDPLPVLPVDLGRTHVLPERRDLRQRDRRPRRVPTGGG